jgi:hypothetical protein
MLHIAPRNISTAIVAYVSFGIFGCGRSDGGPGLRLPPGYALIQKQNFQILYGPDGKIERLLTDRNRDGRVDAVVLFYPNAKPRQGEIDSDYDGRIDRWEVLRTDGSLEKVRWSR